MADSTFSESYVTELLQECKKSLQTCEDPYDAIRSNAQLLRIIQTLSGLVAPTPPPQAASTTASTTVPTPTTAPSDVPSTPTDRGTPSRHLTPQPSWRKAPPHVALPKREGLLTSAECRVCGMDGVKGDFFRRGFKCERCIGMSSVLSENGGLTVSRMAAIADHHPYAARCPQRHHNAFVGDAGPVVDDGVLSGGSSSAAATSNGKAAVYSVAYVPYDTSTDAATASLEATDRASTLAQLRLLAHPSLLYMYACGDDKRRRRCYFVHEAATPLNVPLQLERAQCDAAAVSRFSGDGSFSFFDESVLSSAPSAAHAEAEDSPMSALSSPPRVLSGLQLERHSAGRDGENGSVPPSAGGVEEPSSSPSPRLDVGQVPGQHLEWIRKVAFAALDALEVLHSHQLWHGRCTPTQLFADDDGNIKLRATMTGVNSRWVSLLPDAEHCYLPPEVVSSPSSPPPLSAAVDVCMLGSTLCVLLLAGCPYLQDGDGANGEAIPPPTDDPRLMLQLAKRACGPMLTNNSLSSFVGFLEGLMSTETAKRPSATKALQHSVFTSIRVVNGVPAETMGVSLIVRALEDTASAGEDAAAINGSSHSETPESPDGMSLRRRAVSWKQSSERQAHHEAPMVLLHRATGSNTAGAARQPPLSLFIKEHGPKFQVVRAGKGNLTLYSVRSDPRRRRGQSFGSDSRGGGSASPSF